MIKNLIFDFGDVFLDLDKPATRRELQKFGIPDFSDNMLQKNKEFEKGEISSQAFMDFYCRQNFALSPETFVACWNSVLLEFPKYRLRFLQKLAEEGKFKLILLSNTNNIHINWVQENINFFEDFKACFDAFYLSQEINYRKPDPKIYEFVMEQHDLNPEETLFIDDTRENTDAAAQLGIRTWNIDPAREDVVDLFISKKELF